MFTWIPIHEETAKRLLDYKHRNHELVGIIDRMRQKGLVTTLINDFEADGTKIQLKEIDPFSFFANFNRGTTQENRKALWRFLKAEWNLESEVPQDLDGLPIANNQNSWLMPYARKRTAEHVPLLWSFFEHIMAVEGDALDAGLMQQCLELKMVGLTMLTMGMFWACPRKWIAADSKNLAFATTQGIHERPKNALEYIRWLLMLREMLGTDGAEFSHRAYLASLQAADAEDSGPPSVAEEPDDDSDEPPKRRFWLIAPGVGARNWEEWKASGLASIGWDEVGSLEEDVPWNELVASVHQAYPDLGPKSVASMLWEFSRNIKAGDVIIAKKGLHAVVGWGIAKGSYRFDSEREEFCHTVPIEWRDDRDVAMPDSIQLPMKTLTEMTGKQEFLAHMARSFPGIPGIPGGPGPAVASRFWWLTSNPTIWNPQVVPEGHVEMFTALNENGQPRRVGTAFQEARPGDPVVLYVSSPLRLVVGLGTISRGLAESSNEGVEVRIGQRFAQPLALEQIKEHPGLGAIPPLKQPQGTLFPLSEAEFQVIKEAASGVPKPPVVVLARYTKKQALEDLFMDETKLDEIIELLRRKKNIILQGAPGTGKTFVARRLAYLLMGEEDAERAPITQFHQSTSYEDFIQGYRPNGKDGFELKDGIFHTFCRRALLRPDVPFVFIIDEINRGNLARILGELMMLIEPDKRSEKFAVPLTYARSQDETFHVPPNVHLIGTMNTADRSLSLVDYALRRRFAFVESEPGFVSPMFKDVLLRAGAEAGFIEGIRSRMGQLNDLIAKDTANLGRGYRIGHSFFVPANGTKPDEDWLATVLRFEIRPLLEEYWADDEKSLRKALGVFGLPGGSLED